MAGYEWENPGIMLLSSAAFAEEAAPEQPHHVLPYERSLLELAGVFSPFPPTSLVTVAAAPGEELGYSLHHYSGLLLPPTTADLQPSSASGMGLNGGSRTCFSSSPAGDLTRLGASVCRWLSGEAEAGEGGVLGGRSCNEDVLYGPRARCQADGCAADLETAKHYHRRHKVCEYHSKAAIVVADGRTQRFCQQCSRFHVLSEFDKGKRSCRSRLAEHNRRRRKYQAPPPLPSPPPPTASNSTISAATANPPNPASVCEPPGGVW